MALVDLLELARAKVTLEQLLLERRKEQLGKIMGY